MSNEFYTLIFVPNARAKFRKFQIPVRVAKWALGAASVAGLMLLAILVHYAWMTSEVFELRRLRAENASLLSRTKDYEANVGELKAKLAGLQKIVGKLGVMAGIEKLPDSAVGGMGGASTAEAIAPGLDPGLSLRKMDLSLSDLTRRSEKIESFYKDQSVMLASTPSIWPVRGYLSSHFGNRIDPFTGQRDFHPGLDISAPLGTKIHAPADGVVIFVGDKGGYGHCIMIDHGYGIVTRYAHLEGYNVKAGQRVHRGDVIGYLGQTGRANAPHLHYEVWVRDQAQDPIHYILDEYRSFG
jgi:murein DD-endopeptidase MepM/ murein hydrolase activator NlpD